MLNPDEIYEKLDAASGEWVEYNAIAENYEKECKELLAKFTLESKQSTVEGRKNEALINPEYMDKKDLEIDFRKKANRAKRKLADIETYLEVWRTIEATKRAEMNMK